MLGAGLFERVAQFLMDLRTTYDGIAASSAEIDRTLSTAQTLVVTTADPTPMREAIRFFRDLPPNAQHPTSVIFNRSLPVSWVDATAQDDDGDPEGQAHGPVHWLPPVFLLPLLNSSSGR